MGKHSGIQNADFWRILLVNLIVSVMSYHLTSQWIGSLTMTTIFIVGMLLPGPYASYLLDRYRRRDICVASIMMLAFCVWGCSVLHSTEWIRALCFVQGVTLMLYNISLASTILIDITNTHRRGHVAILYYWITRLSLPIAFLFPLLLKQTSFDMTKMAYASLVLMALASFLILRIELPFRTPSRTNKLSLDRFLLRCNPVSALLHLMVMLPVGYTFSHFTDMAHFAYMALGIVLSFVFHVIAFRDADNRAEMIIGLIFVFVSLVLLCSQDVSMLCYVAGFLGFGMGTVGCKWLEILTAISKHTERGAAHSTHFLLSEVALLCGYAMFSCSSIIVCLISFLTIPSCILYYRFWFVFHKGR